ncbi:MAG: hypothetical protein LBD33_02090 [Puniceicoccales bacterium]|nr:hypothetical protein [Puniceicoccales bacterium]
MRAWDTFSYRVITLIGGGNIPALSTPLTNIFAEEDTNAERLDRAGTPEGRPFSSLATYAAPPSTAVTMPIGSRASRPSSLKIWAIRQSARSSLSNEVRDKISIFMA